MSTFVCHSSCHFLFIFMILLAILCKSSNTRSNLATITSKEYDAPVFLIEVNNERELIVLGCPSKYSSQDIPLAHNHCNISSPVATTRTKKSHGQPFERAHFNTFRCPPRAAKRQVNSSHGHPCARAHCSTSK